ncbi:MAG: hypothetical protein HPY50_07570 [Firmicutes bacterium]|nr:hypothetical protein [Bacillota bacterium]
MITNFLFYQFLKPLLLTEIIEITAALVLGYRDRDSLAAVALINLITNPLANLLCWLGAFLGVVSLPTMVFFIEPLIVLGEWLLLFYTLRLNPGRLFLLSLLINLASFAIGWILPWKGGIGF